MARCVGEPSFILFLAHGGVRFAFGSLEFLVFGHGTNFGFLVSVNANIPSVVVKISPAVVDGAVVSTACV